MESIEEINKWENVLLSGLENDFEKTHFYSNE